MRRKSSLPELLAPAGDFDCLVAAVSAGADAVYVGGKRFGARAYAKNFNIEELTRAVNYCHLHGVKLYVTLNIILIDSEIEEALHFAAELYRIGVDALIVADLGLIKVIKEAVPDLPLHASTQMSVHNTKGADEAYKIGCERVVLARELSSENISSVTEKCLPEVEVFLHGALCVCHSGQCLFSSMIGGRSGNRGECAQPCRLPYNGNKYLLSLRDLSLSHHIKELIDMGVSSLKIEGRMKSKQYVYKVTSVYRRLIDSYRDAGKCEDEILKKAFSRGGFTDGYFVSETFSNMTGIRSDDDKKASKESEICDIHEERVNVKCHVTMKLSEPCKMTLTTKDEKEGSSLYRSVTVFGAVPERAKNSPLTESDVKARLIKMGNTFLNLESSDIDLDLQDGINLSPSLINALRRSATIAFESFERPSVPEENIKKALEDCCVKVARNTSFRKSRRAIRTALFFNTEVLDRVFSNRNFKDFFDIVFVPLWRIDEVKSDVTGIYLPPVIMDSETEKVKTYLARAKERGVKYALAGNIGHFEFCREFGFQPVGDFRLNIANSYAVSTLNAYFGENYIPSVELTLKDFRNVGGIETVYGRIPLMLTERCFMKENFGCEKCSKVSFTDRKGVKFPIIREFEHRNLILNSVVTYYCDKLDELKNYGVSGEHYIFTLENEKEVLSVIYASKNGTPCPLNAGIRRIGKRNIK